MEMQPTVLQEGVDEVGPPIDQRHVLGQNQSLGIVDSNLSSASLEVDFDFLLNHVHL
tara:strand:- start:4633 stop:4803 length:171 start_codon:yes stop_codon:yes gene_type:complete